MRKKLMVALVYYIVLVLVISFFYDGLLKISLVEKTFLIFLFLFLTPVWLVKKIFVDNLIDYNFPGFKVWKKFFLLATILAVTSLLVLVFMVQWRWKLEDGTYVWKIGDLLVFWLETVFILPVSLLAQEFFFRGFLLRSFARNFNCSFSVFSVGLLTVFFLALAKIVSLQAGILLGVFLLNLFLSVLVCWKKSIIWSLAVYWAGLLAVRFVLLYQIGERIIERLK